MTSFTLPNRQDKGLILTNGAARPGDIVLNGETAEDIDGDQDVVAEDVLTEPDKVQASDFRKVVRLSTIHNNEHDSEALVSATLLHQRRRRAAAKNEEVWIDTEQFKPASLHANEQVAFALRHRETKRLYLALTKMYKGMGKLNAILAEEGKTIVDGTDIAIIQGRGKEILERLFEAEGEKVWDYIEALEPDMLQAIALQKQHSLRQQAIETFQTEIARDRWSEGKWEQFFRRNTWIFGFGLTYHFLTKVQDQPDYGGTTLDRKGGQRGDALMATEGYEHFTVLVDLKKPSSRLLHPTPYRGTAIYRVDEELAGGVAQLQANCETWLRDGSLKRANVLDLASKRIHTHDPKGILVIGNTSEFEKDDGRLGSFDRFRRNVRNPEIVTYDELLARAVHLASVDFGTPNSDSDGPTTGTDSAQTEA